MIAEERRRKLLAALKQGGALSVARVSKLLRVSRMTIHRDLDMLSAAGLLRKVHGGAMPVSSPRPASEQIARPFTERVGSHAPAKELIARHLAKLLIGVKSLALDASSTVFCLAPLLKPAPDGPFVMTNSVPLFQELQRRHAGFRIALTGGEPQARSGSLVGPLAIRSLEGMRFDCVVLSAAGLMEEEGMICDSAPEDAAIKQAFLARAGRAILALDKTKINFLAPYPLGRLSQFDLLVTEDGVQEVKKGRRNG
jgi:DeoR/GlpR family transcriptional regulator of sugar metabolism